MKKTFSRLICLLVVFSVIVISLFSVPAFADNATISINKKTINVGDTVTVTVGFNSGLSLMVMTGSLSYNSAVLEYVSGADSASGSTLNFYKELSGQPSTSVAVTFKAIAEGSSSLSTSVEGSDGSSKGSASAGTTVNVTTPAPSSNANLASIKVSSGSLSPAFSANKTDYTVNVKNGVSQITIKANAADGKATVAGAGTFKLKEGDNKYTLTVTAADDTKKSYNVTVHLMTAAETEEQNAKDRENDPLLITIGDKDFHIQNDLTGIAVPSNFTAATQSYKSGNITSLTDVASKYNICYLKSDDGTVSDWYTYDNNTFKRLNYLMSNGKMYIIKNNATSPSGDWYKVGYDLFKDVTVTSYKSNDERLADFYVFYCYYNGEEQYFRYDKSDESMQRYPDFEKVVQTVKKEEKTSFIDKIKNLSIIGKIVVALAVLAVICVIVIVILLIVSNSGPKEDPAIDEYYGKTETADFDIVSYDDEEEELVEENTNE